MTLGQKKSREALEHVLTNVFELKSESPIWNTLIHNYCGFIEDLFNTTYTDIKNLCYKTMIMTLLMMTGYRLLTTNSIIYALQAMIISEDCVWLVL